MKRLLLSACLVGVVFAGYPPKFPQTNQVTPATADPMTSERAVSIVPKNRIVQRVAFRPSATDSVEQATLKGSPLEPTVEEMFKSALPQSSEAKDENKGEAADENAMWVKVIRGATVHSGPSVSAPVVSYLAVGKELHLVELPTGVVPGLRSRDRPAWMGLRQVLCRADRPSEREARSGARAAGACRRRARARACGASAIESSAARAATAAVPWPSASPSGADAAVSPVVPGR